MITVHHLENSRSQRILWLLEELGVEYEVLRYERRPDMQAPAELRAIHPLGKSPVITHNGQTIAESGAIIEYLVDVHNADQLRPQAGSPEYLDYRFWMHYAEGSLMPLMVMTLIFLKIPESPMPFFVKPVAKGLCSKVRSNFLAPQIKNHLEFIEAHLASKAYFAGDDFSAVDIQMGFPIEAAASRIGLSDYPHTQSWLDKMRQRPAYTAALEAGGPYALAG